MEVKLSVKAEKDIITQLHQYCNLDRAKLDKSKTIESNFYNNHVVVIDTEMIYVYNNQTKILNQIFPLDKINNRKDIELRKLQ